MRRQEPLGCTGQAGQNYRDTQERRERQERQVVPMANKDKLKSARTNDIKSVVRIIRVPDWDPVPLLKAMRAVELAKERARQAKREGA